MNKRMLMVGACASLLSLLSASLLLTACSKHPSEELSAKAAQLLEDSRKARDFQRIFVQADSLERDGSLTQARAYYWRGYASDRTDRKRMAEFYFNTGLNAALATSSDDPDILAKIASHLTNLLMVRGDYEAALKAARPVVARLEELQCDTTSDYVNLLIYIGCCQAGLGKSGSATADGFDKAYQKHLDNVKKNHTDEAYKNAIAGLINITHAFIHTENYRDGESWNGRFSEMLNEYEQRPGIDGDYVDKQVARYNLYQAQTLEGLGRTVEAAKAFDAFRTTQFATTPEGRIMANDYLFAAQRWGEAADNYQSLDALLAQQGGMNLENIRDLLLKKYQANLLVGRRDSAAAVSMFICDSITGAFAKAKLVDAEEQATIVRKVEELGAQQVTDARRKQLEELCLFALVLLLVVGYVIYRRYRHHLLHKAHDELREDYGQLEATATERSRTATEQRLAAAMQEYVAHQPQTRRDDLTLLVAQTPGTMAGGSFCETIQQGNTLLFAIGSATGKGVAAATTSAMAWAQFRTAAAITSAPEAIVTAISEAIADSKHLPVRLFVGALNLTNGELNYSNAGNNTPLLMADELALLTDDDSTPAGSHLGTVYKACTTTLDKGKFLFLYANGVAEATDTNGKPLGDNHLRGMALQTAKIDPSPEPFFSHIQEAIASYTGARPQVSDITFIVIARK